jgi:signal transduction histidine kinase
MQSLDSIAAATRLDLILLDILMPNGMDGIETCRRIKSQEALRTIPVIFLTGKDDHDTMIRAFKAGGADYVLKPFDTEVLLARVRAHSELGRLTCRLEATLAERTRELKVANAKLRRLVVEVSLIEEREKKRLGAELHDSPMQKLALAQMQFASAVRHRDRESEGLMATGLELLRDAMGELRSLQFELSPPLLYQEGLGPALRWLASHTTQRFGIDLAYAESGPPPLLDREITVVLFQCARELVHNLIKHAETSRGRIELTIDDGIVRVAVCDDGRGMTPGGSTVQSAGSGGYGLFSVQERLVHLGGDLTIASGASGTRAVLRVPLKSRHGALSG